MPSTFVHALVPSACVVASSGCLPRLTRTQWIRLVIASVFLANSPDLDLIPATLFLRHWDQIHREWGHNFIALSLFCIFGRWMLCRWVSPALDGKAAWTLSISLVMSHVLLDSVGEVNGHHTMVPILWPFFDWEFMIPLPIFTGLTHHQITGNPIIAYLTSPHFWKGILLRELAASAVIVVAWAGGMRLIAKLRKIRDVEEKITPLRSARS